MRIELFHQLLLHVPINIVWRLIGLNHRLNRLLLSERFWKEKCELEFSLLHTKIVSYRRYYFIRSNKIHGHLYNLSGEIVIRGISWYHDLRGTMTKLYLQNNKLHFGYNWVIPGVSSVFPLNDDYDNLVLIMIDGSRKFLHLSFLYSKKDKYELTTTWRDETHVRSLLQYESIINDYGRDNTIFTGWLLLTSGMLYYYFDEGNGGVVSPSTGYTERVIQIASIDGRLLLILFDDGSGRILKMNENREIVSIAIEANNYIKATVIGKNFYLFTEDGKIDQFEEDFEHDLREGYDSTPDETITSTLPLRGFFYESNWVDPDHAHKIIVEINGDGYLLLESDLAPNRVRTNYEGLSNVGDGRFVVATKRKD